MRLPVGANLPALVLCGLVGVLAGEGAYTFHYAEGTAYLRDDPAACANCHVMRDPYDSWQKAGHHAVATCNDCHLPVALVPKMIAKAENGWRHSKGFTLQDFHEPIRIHPRNAEILEANCIRCHTALVAGLLPGGGPHAHEDEPFGCVRCHVDVGHGPAR